MASDTTDSSFDGAELEGQSAATARERRLHLRAFDYWRELKGDEPQPLFRHLTVDGLAPFRDQSLLVERGAHDADGNPRPDSHITVRFFGAGLSPLFQSRPTVGDNFREFQDSGFARELLSLLDNRSAADRAAEFEYVDLHVDSRGVMLPLSRDGESVDFLWVVISVKSYAEDTSAPATEPDLAAEAFDASDVDGGSGSTPASGADQEAGSDPAVSDDIDRSPYDYTPRSLEDVEDDRGAEDPSGSRDFDGVSAEENMTAFAGDQVSEASDADVSEQSPEPDPETDSEQFADTELGAEISLAHEAGLTGGGSIDFEPVPELDENPNGVPEDAGADEEAHADALSAPLPGAEEDVEPEPQPDFGEAPEAVPGPDFVDVEPRTKTQGADFGDSLASVKSAAQEHLSAAAPGFERLYGLLSDALRLYEQASLDPAPLKALLDAEGLKVQTRAPFTPILKLIFGKDYDKTRLTEYGAAIAYAVREGVTSDTLVEFLAAAPGGIKGCVKAERAARRGDKTTSAHSRLKDAKRKLRSAAPQDLDGIKLTGEFDLVMVRRGEGGRTEALGRVDVGESTMSALLERQARRVRRKRS